jgi:hypothetical protein
MFDESFVGWGNEDIEFAYRLWRNGAEINFSPGASVEHMDDADMRDPFVREARGQLAQFEPFLINTVRFLSKYPGDQLLVDLLTEDLKGFRIVEGRCVRDISSTSTAEIYEWAKPKLS